MSFFYAPAKKEAAKPKAPSKARRADIPITSLQKLGCEACPRNEDKTLLSPKMEPSGALSPDVYLLGSAPSEKEDDTNMHWTDKPGEIIWSKFGRNFMERHVRSNFITQCRGDLTDITTECCRNRIVADIEESKPLLIVTIGDAPFQWATGASGGVLAHRGSVFVVKIGRHVCYLLPILYPNFAFKKSYNKSEYELALEHDVAKVKEMVKKGADGPFYDLAAPKVYGKPYDEGVEIITGHEPGDMQRLEKALAELSQQEDLAVDLESNGLRPHFISDKRGKPDAKIWMVSVGTFERTISFPLDHPDGWGTDARRAQAWALLGRFLLESKEKVAHNLAMELEWFLYFFGDKMLRYTEWGDTMAMCHTLDERPRTKSLGFQTLMNFGFDVKAQSNIDVRRILEYPLRDTLRYCGMDTKWTSLLKRTLMPRVRIENLAEYERKVKLAPTLVLTEAKGMPVDFAYAQDMNDLLKSRIEAAEAKLRRCEEVKEFSIRFGTFSPSNPDHVLKLMRDICRRDEVRVEDRRGKEVTVRWTSDEEALLKIPAKEVPSAALVLEHRGASKLLGTYVQPVLRREIVCPDGRVRSKYSSMVAVTGRLAAEDPNVQNWPKRKHREIRGIIYAEAGEVIGALDYGQIEFRVVGMASEDENLVKACWTGYDVHKFWAQRMIALYPAIQDYIIEAFDEDLGRSKAKDGKEFDLDKAILKILRQEAKNGWVFPQLFGSSLRSCAEQLHLPEDIAEDLGAEFWDEFRGVKLWQEKLLKNYERNLYVETLGGRKRRGPMTKNEIINMPIQGTALDIVAEGMNAVSELSQINDDPELQPNLNVHDDLSFWLREETAVKKIEFIATEMCRPRFDYINVPLVVEASIGKRWHELKEIKVYRSDELFNLRNPYK